MIELANLAREVAGPGAIRLDPRDLRGALHSHWESLQKESEPQTRVATMNLLLGVSHPEDCLGLTDVLEPLSHSHPGRVVVFVFDSETEEASIEGWFNYTCMKQHPERICSERIVIYCPGSPARVPSLVLPLTVPGLPVFHWWRGEPPFGSDLLERLVEASDRVVFDSNRFSLSSGMSRMSRLINDPYHTEQAFSDLSWGRAQLARERVAALFDGQAGAAALSSITEVSITGPGERPGPSGLLLAGWLASRLGWKVVNP
ncbi:MAG: glucose-6-phosphate dehydrogenase assembly protein OpcA, partial [Candidatus Eremiobacteraeota bacterium]|nr:glucose-6-phosphate dehydrogenase assembly protein OpcA [Candidatus Eremiobacteraeota bacterium]